MVPSLSHLSSNLGSFDGNSDLKFDDLEATMPPKKRQRLGSKFPPQKQTITQMDPFRPQAHLEEEPLPSDTEYLVSPPRRKKRKSIATTPVARTAQTRSVKKKAAEVDAKEDVDVPPTKDENQTPIPRQTAASPIPKSQDMTMPPPQTPKNVRRKVIPSSQSPAETPLSICRKSSRKTQVVTPLAERSVNTPSKSRFTLRRKSVQWAPKLEVADSTDVENDDSQLFFPVIMQSHPLANKVRDSTPQPQVARLRLPPKIFPNFNATQNQDFRRKSLHDVGRQATIADSDEDIENLASQSFDRHDNHETSQSCSAPDSSDNAVASFRVRETAKHTPQSCKDDKLDHESYETVPTQPLPQPMQHPSPHSTPTTVSCQSEDAKYPLNSKQAATKSPQDLLQSSSPTRPLRSVVLETESQFENAWRDYTPPLKNEDLLVNNGAEIRAHEPSLPIVHSTGGTDSSDDLQSLPPIPLSQATTTDITQASLRQTRLLRQTPTYDTQPQVSSSPLLQRQAFLSSSPFNTRKGPAADTYMGYQGWNGVPMTESQLLPDSLLNDSLGLPLMPGVEEELELELEKY
ncbi:MAG: hypothetical protein Q9209_007889 [Squamulea sp. 1 TL-2023]